MNKLSSLIDNENDPEMHPQTDVSVKNLQIDDTFDATVHPQVLC